jgi:hypothetical protein
LRLVSQSCVGAAKGFNEPLNASHKKAEITSSSTVRPSSH